MFLSSFIFVFKPLPDVDVVLYESKLVQERKRKNPSYVDGAQTDRQQKAFKVCRKYYVSMGNVFFSLVYNSQMEVLLPKNFVRKYKPPPPPKRTFSRWCYFVTIVKAVLDSCPGITGRRNVKTDLTTLQA